jgi:hypothetical protein
VRHRELLFVGRGFFPMWRRSRGISGFNSLSSDGENASMAATRSDVEAFSPHSLGSRRWLILLVED